PSDPGEHPQHERNIEAASQTPSAYEGHQREDQKHEPRYDLRREEESLLPFEALEHLIEEAKIPLRPRRLEFDRAIGGWSELGTELHRKKQNSPHGDE